MTKPNKIGWRNRVKILLTGENEQPARKSRRSLDAAAGGRLLASWLSSSQSLDSKIRMNLVTVRNRSRQLFDNDSYARKFSTLCKTNVIGPNGITLNMDVRDTNGQQDTYACNLIENAWFDFGRSKNYLVSRDADRTTASNLQLETLARDGECISRMVRGADNPFGFALQLIEPDYLDEQKNEILPNGNYIKMGVEYEPVYKRRVAYWLRTVHPGDDFLVQTGRRSEPSQRVPADEIIHCHLKDYIEQSRGIPWMVSAMTRLHQLGEYEKATLVAARIGACKMAFLEKTAATVGPEYQGDTEDEDGTQINEIEPGRMEELPFGMHVNAVDWNNPNADHPAFVKAMLRGVSAGVSTSYNSLANDLEGVNFSSIRAGLLEERDSWKMLQNWFISAHEEVIFERWLLMALTTQAIPLPVAKFAKFNKPTFMGRRWPWVDPMKDVEAAALAVDRGFTTRQQIVAEMHGQSIEDTYPLFKADNELQKENKLDFSEKIPGQQKPKSDSANPAS